MKIFFIMLLLLVSIISLILMLDILLGTSPNQILAKFHKPFEVSDAAEYFTSFVLLAFLILKPLFVFLIKKKTKTSSSK